MCKLRLPKISGEYPLSPRLVGGVNLKTIDLPSQHTLKEAVLEQVCLWRWIHCGWSFGVAPQPTSNPTGWLWTLWSPAWYRCAINDQTTRSNWLDHVLGGWWTIIWGMHMTALECGGAESAACCFFMDRLPAQTSSWAWCSIELSYDICIYAQYWSGPTVTVHIVCWSTPPLHLFSIATPPINTSVTYQSFLTKLCENVFAHK